MAISFPNNSVTQDGWNVGRTLSADLPKGGKLSVFRGFYGRDKKGFPKIRHGDHDGRLFSTDSEYESFVREHGYVQPYLNASRATFKATNRANIRRWTRDLVAAVNAAGSHADIVKIADRQKAIVIAAGCDILDAMTFGLAAYTIGRKFRPDICKSLSLSA